MSNGQYLRTVVSGSEIWMSSFVCRSAFGSASMQCVNTKRQYCHHIQSLSCTVITAVMLLNVMFTWPGDGVGRNFGEGIDASFGSGRHSRYCQPYQPHVELNNNNYSFHWTESWDINGMHRKWDASKMGCIEMGCIENGMQRKWNASKMKGIENRMHRKWDSTKMECIENERHRK